MNCPKCGNEMIDAQATNFGAKYKYCRTCKMDIDEIRSGAKPPVHQRPVDTKAVPQPALANFGCDSHLGGGHYRASHTSNKCQCGQIYFDMTVDAWRDRGPRASSSGSYGPNCSYGCNPQVTNSNCPTHSSSMNSSMSSGMLTHGLIDYSNSEKCRTTKWLYPAGSAQARVHFFWPSRIGCDCGEFDAQGRNQMTGAPMTHSADAHRQLMGAKCACPGCRTPGSKNPSPPNGPPTGIPGRQPCGYCGSGSHDAHTLAQCPNYVPPSSFMVQKTHLIKANNYFKQAAASDEMFRALQFAEAYSTKPGRLRELLSIPVSAPKTTFDYGKLEVRVVSDMIIYECPDEESAERAHKMMKELADNWRKEYDRRIMRVFNGGFLNATSRKSRRRSGSR